MRSCLGVLRSEVTAGVAETLLTYLLTPVQREFVLLECPSTPHLATHNVNLNNF